MKITTKFAALAALAVLAFPAAASAQVNTSKTYRITTTWSLALEIAGASRGDGAPLTQWPVNGGSNQHWRFDFVSAPNHYRIRNVNSGKCLTSPGGSVAPRTKLVQWTCGRAGQTWSVDLQTDTPGQSPAVRLSIPGADAAIDIPENTPYWGTQLQLWPKITSIGSQFFVLNPID